MTTAQVNTSEGMLRSDARVSLRNGLASQGPCFQENVPELQVRTAENGDRSSLIATLALAFGNDPAVRWMYPEPDRYLAYFPRFVSAFGGDAFMHGTAHFIAGGKASALWLPPGVNPDEGALMGLFEESIPEQHRRVLLSVFEQMGHYHPDEPHWYLPLIGVDPTEQRKGYGSVLLDHALRACDRDGLAAYLESSNPANIPLYQRHGFEVMGTIQVGTSPPVTPMIRRPR